jgi:hypothetical protein
MAGPLLFVLSGTLIGGWWAPLPSVVTFALLLAIEFANGLGMGTVLASLNIETASAYRARRGHPDPPRQSGGGYPGAGVAAHAFLLRAV